MVLGIDISDNNSDLNFTAAKNDSVKICYIKTYEGMTFINKVFRHQLDNARANGFLIGFYQFANSCHSPEEQANNFKNFISQYDYDLLPALDIEENKWTVENYTDFIQRFATVFGGKDNILVYACRSDYKDKIFTKGYKMWLASYGSNNALKIVDNTLMGWQYADNGINGHTDMTQWFNIPYKNSSASQSHSTSTNNSGITITSGMVTANVLNVRDEPSMSGNVIGSLNKYDTVRVNPDLSNKDWYSIYFGQHGGFVSSQYITANVTRKVSITASCLNVREQPSTSSRILGQVYRTHEMNCDLSRSTESFYKVSDERFSGYISKQYAKII